MGETQQKAEAQKHSERIYNFRFSELAFSSLNSSENRHTARLVAAAACTAVVDTPKLAMIAEGKRETKACAPRQSNLHGTAKCKRCAIFKTYIIAE